MIKCEQPPNESIVLTQRLSMFNKQDEGFLLLGLA